MATPSSYSAFNFAWSSLCRAPGQQEQCYSRKMQKHRCSVLTQVTEPAPLGPDETRLSWQLCFVRHSENKLSLSFFQFCFVPVQLSCLLKLAFTLCQVRQLQESAAQLRTVYAGEKAEAIACREHEVMQCWKELLTSCEECRVQITTETDKLRFFGMVRDQIMWMDSIICQIGTGEKPRYLQYLLHMHVAPCIAASISVHHMHCLRSNSFIFFLKNVHMKYHFAFYGSL